MNRRSINLLTSRFRFYLLMKARVLQWSGVWAACSLIMISWWQVENDRLGETRDALAIMESRCAPLRQMQQQNLALAERANNLKSHQSLLARLDDEQVPYRLLGLVSKTTADCVGTIRIESLAFERRLESAPSISEKPGSASTTENSHQSDTSEKQEVATLTLNGIADDNITVSQFVGLLRDSSVFQSVELVSSVGADALPRRTQMFLVKCDL